MRIKKQEIISWLLDMKHIPDKKKMGVPLLSNPAHYLYLNDAFLFLMEIRDENPNWGLPELIMPSFEKVMSKSAKAFIPIDHKLFEEFYNDNVCGILLDKDFGTVVYGFDENRIYVWVFTVREEKSQLSLFYYVDSTPDNMRNLYVCPTLTQDAELFIQPYKTYSSEVYEALTNKIIIYLAVKKYVKIETVVIPVDGCLKMRDVISDYKFKDKIHNDCGQEIIVMDSRWFRRIVNDNDVVVRGFFRFQNKKDENGVWYKELIFVDSYVRHGYHRKALIENANNG